MSDVIVIDSDDVPKPNAIKKMAYGGTQNAPVAEPRNYRLERGQPFLRGGKYVYATPQFKALTLFSPISANVQLPPTTTTPTSSSYPSKV